MKQNYLIKTLLLVLTMFVSMSTWAEKGTILFGTPNVKITSSSVTAEDNLGNSWTISSTGTTSYTQHPTCSQIGSSSKPASSIVFTTTLPDETTISSVSIKLGGFNGTAGSVAIDVDGNKVGSGKLDASEDVTVSSTTAAKGKTITITITDIAKGVKVYNITYETGGEAPANYAVDVVDGIANGTVEASATSATEGTVITLTAAPASGYEFSAWDVKDADENAITVTDNKFTMPASDVTISAAFSKIEVPDVPTPSGKVTIVCEDVTWAQTGEQETYQLAASASGYSVVVKKNNGASNPVAYDAKEIRAYAKATVTISAAKAFNQVVFNISAQGLKRLAPITADCGIVAAQAAGDKTVTWTCAEGTKSVTFTVGEKANYGSDGATKAGQLDFLSIDIASADDDEPTTATISLKANCTDGDFVYGTYSNASAWVVPANLIVSEIGIVDGLIVTESYETGDVVPAKTGVLVAALDGGNYTINLSDKAGESVLGEENALKASSVAMTGDNKFYRLTMHKGEQIGFWWGAEDGAAFSIEANKAYLAVSNEAAEAKANFWFGGETAIKNINANSNKVIYNLAGQRVMNAQKGLYIINGKKVVK